MDYKKISTAKEKAALYANYKETVSRLTLGGTDENGRFESDDNVLRFTEWQKLSQSSKDECYRQWDDYYEKVKSSRAYIIYREMKEALKSGVMAKFRELGLEAKEMEREQREENKYQIEKPKVLNPYNFLNSPSVNKYKNAVWGIQTLENESRKIESNYVSNLFK